MSDIVARLQNITQPPWVDTGTCETLEGLLRWFKSNSLIFLFLIIVALALTLALHLPTPDSHRSQTQIAQQTLASHPSGESSTSVEITVRANPNYQGSDWYSKTSQLGLPLPEHTPFLTTITLLD